MTRRIYRTVSVEVEIGDVLDELTDEDLLEEVAARHIREPGRELVEEAIAAIRRGDAAEAITILERYAYPKWSAFDLSRQAYEAAIAAERKGADA